ncbi:MAG: flagellar basal body P-ring formation protein FlgA [Pseudomonadales bacterium]|nr:flagellar basal body P-ring formation protein FlgA [Pseudomonadales bacterium]
MSLAKMGNTQNHPLSDAGTGFLSIAIIVLSLASIFPVRVQTAHADNLRFEQPTLIAKNAHDFVLSQASKRYPDAQISVSMNSINANTKLTPCQKIKHTISGDRRYGRVSVKIRCQTPVEWTIWLTGAINVKTDMVIAKNAIKRGNVIQPSELQITSRTLAEARNRYLSKLSQVVGSEAKKDISEGAIIHLQQLKPARLVRKGELVQISSINNGFLVDSSGIALNDGVQGQQVSVRNQQSKRVIHAWVTRQGIVSTNPSPELLNKQP